MKYRSIWLVTVLAGLCSCKKDNDPNPVKTVEGTYIGNTTYIYQGKNPIDGAFYHDTIYADTFHVTLLHSDSIQFTNKGLNMKFAVNDSNQYSTFWIYFQLRNFDTLEYHSHFYSGIDADHYYQDDTYFIGVK